MPRIPAAILALLALACLCASAGAQSAPPRMPMADIMAAAPPLGDIVLGSPDAKVTVVEYTSPLCPYCGKFRREAWPGVKAAFVDTGKVRWIVREFPIGNADYVGFALARCSGNAGAPAVIDTLFGRQADLGRANASSGAFVEFAGLMGYGRDRVAECMGRRDVLNSVDESRRMARSNLGVDGTPTFFVAGQRLVGDLSQAEMSNVLERAAGR